MAKNYRTYVSELLRRVRWARGYWGERLTIGFYALFADMIAEGAREANQARLTVQSHDDALGDIGLTRGIPRYFGEAPIQFRGRLRRAFPIHEQRGTDLGVEAALSDFGYPNAVVYEDWEWFRPPQPWWSQGWIYFPPGSHTVTPSTETYGGGATYGDGTIYGVAGITIEEIAALRQLVAFAKRGSFIFREFIFATSGATYGTGTLYNGGAVYGTPVSQAVIGAT